MSERRMERDPAGPSLGELRRRIGEQVQSAERVIAALRAEVDELQRDNRALVRERDELQRARAKLTAVELQRAQADSRNRVTAADHRRLQQAARELERDNERLAARCEQLERALADAVDGRDAMRAEMETMDEQIRELERMVDLLSESD